MNNKSFSAILLAAALLCCTATPARAADTQMNWQPPGFAIENTDQSVFRYPQDLNGPTIVFFWASWCPYCKAVMPHLQSILDEFPGEVAVLALNFREDKDPAQVLAEYGYNFHLLAEADPVAEAWGVKATPGIFLADDRGQVVFDFMRIPEEAYSQSVRTDEKGMKHYQRASRMAPVWAAQLRIALDQLKSH